MKISRASDYALRALFTLVEFWGKGPVSISELAERNDVPKKFLERLLLDLRKIGVVTSVAGRHGGYLLAREPNLITMGEVVRHFDGVLAPIHCVSVTDYRPCSQEPTCRFRRVFLELRNHAARVMDGATLASVYAGKVVSTEEVFRGELTAGDGI